MDSDFFDGLGFGSGETAAKEAVGEKRGGRHGHSNSVDGFCTASFEVDSVGGLLGVDAVKKAMAPDRLAELALIDPKRAKRFFIFFIFFNKLSLLSPFSSGLLFVCFFFFFIDKPWSIFFFCIICKSEHLFVVNFGLMLKSLLVFFFFGEYLSG